MKFLYAVLLFAGKLWNDTVLGSGVRVWGDLSSERSTSGWESFCKRSLTSFWFSPLVSWKVPGTIPDWTRTSEFRRNASICDSTASIPSSVLLNRLEIFLSTLFPISPETCVTYSSLLLGIIASLHTFFLKCFSWLSLLNGADSHSFLKVAIGEYIKIFKHWIRRLSTSNYRNLCENT